MPLTAVRINAEWQRPLLINDETVKSYVDRMQRGCDIPPIEVSEREDGFYDIKNGHHRFKASHQCSFTHISVKIIEMPSIPKK